MELNEFGLRVWKHKTNKRLFLRQDYRWVDRLSLIDETEGRQHVDSVWEPMTVNEYEKVTSKYQEIYE